MENNDRQTLYNYNPSITLESTTTDNAHKKKRAITEVEEEEEEGKILRIAMQKMKRVIIDNRQYGLRVTVMNANGIDNPMLHPYVQSRRYSVACGVGPGFGEFSTSVTEGFICLSWMEKGMILFKNPNDHGFFNVEVFRYRSNVDPGTSNGRVVVGRARIPFPKVVNYEIRGIFELVRTYQDKEPQPEGIILLAMTLERFR